MILVSLLAAATLSHPPLSASGTIAVRVQVSASCTASAREIACRGAARAAPLSRRLEAASADGPARLVVEY